MLKNLFIYFAGVTTVFFCACNTPRYVYSPLAANTPVLQKKGQGFINAGFSTSRVLPVSTSSRPVLGADFMGAYAFHKNIGIQGQYSFRNERDNYFLKNGFIIPFPDSSGGSSTVHYKRNHAELGLGGFLPLNSSKTLTINLWAGIGIGNTRMKEDNEVGGINYQRYYNFSILRTFWQPYLSFSPSSYFQISYFFKFSRIQFSNIQTNLSEAEQLPRRLQSLTNSSIPVTEGGYHITFGFRGMESFRIFHQLSFAGTPAPRNIRSTNLAIGIQYNFEKITF